MIFFNKYKNYYLVNNNNTEANNFKNAFENYQEGKNAESFIKTYGNCNINNISELDHAFRSERSFIENENLLKLVNELLNANKQNINTEWGVETKEPEQEKEQNNNKIDKKIDKLKINLSSMTEDNKEIFNKIDQFSKTYIDDFNFVAKNEDLLLKKNPNKEYVQAFYNSYNDYLKNKQIEEKVKEFITFYNSKSPNIRAQIKNGTYDVTNSVVNNMIKEYRIYSDQTKAQQFFDSIYIFEKDYGKPNPNNILQINNLITMLKKFEENKEMIKELEEEIKDLEDQKDQDITKKKESEQREKELEVQKKQLEKLAVFSKGTNPIIDNLTNFNKMTQRLEIFYKGKIKPNLKIIEKSKISDMLNDMNVLDQNFNEVKLELHNKYQSIFAIDGKMKDKKENAFITTIENNFSKISSNIISSLKSFYSLGLTGSGLLMLDGLKKRMNNPHKYLL